MATDLATANVTKAAPFQLQHQQFNFAQPNTFAQPAVVSPLGSGPNTPTNVSPTSPRNTSHLAAYPHHAPPIRPLKTPIYVPAALRRTEKPARQSPPKCDSLVDTPNSSWGSSTASGKSGAGPKSKDGTAATVMRIRTDDSASLYNDMPLSPVAGPITRNHWQPDSSTHICTASACHAPFGLFNRRHHCRKCGGIFCASHSARLVRLSEQALFHPDGDWQRACDRCHGQFREWEHLRSSRTNSESSGSTTPAVAVRGEDGEPRGAAIGKRPGNARVGSLATSLGGNWNWSTF